MFLEAANLIYSPLKLGENPVTIYARKTPTLNASKIEAVTERFKNPVENLCKNNTHERRLS